MYMVISLTLEQLVHHELFFTIIIKFYAKSCFIKLGHQDEVMINVKEGEKGVRKLHPMLYE